MNLTDEQRFAVQSRHNKIVVKATASSGKTAVLKERIKRLIEEGVKPENIYSISYTTYSAEEIRQRVNNENVFCGTLHSLGLKILLSNKVNGIRNAIEEQNYSFLLKECLKPGIIVPTIEHLLVDEFQDITEEEYLFIKKLNSKNLFLVGDINQCIYAFKGAKPEILESIANDFSTELLSLTKNFRNTQEILEYSQKYITSPMCSISARGKRPHYEILSTSFMLMIQKLKRVPIEELSKWTILTRTNKELDEAIKTLERNGIQYVSWKRIDDTNTNTLIRELQQKKGVKVMTTHCSKGLEFDNVICVNLTYFNKEEVRISYVAVTRARNNLYITKMYLPKTEKSVYSKQKDFLF